MTSSMSPGRSGPGSARPRTISRTARPAAVGPVMHVGVLSCLRNYDDGDIVALPRAVPVCPRHQVRLKFGPELALDQRDLFADEFQP
jgi:hypothetical protein